MAKATYSKPTAQLDMEERAKEGYEPPAKLSQGVDPEPSETAYYGVDPIYQNYANDTEKPLLSEKGAESKLEGAVYADEVDEDFGATPEGTVEAKDDGYVDRAGNPGTSTGTPPSSTTPPSS